MLRLQAVARAAKEEAHPDHVAGCQGVPSRHKRFVLTHRSPLGIRSPAVRWTPSIQDNSGLPQRPATGSVVG
jgi:hypothetical protein